MSKAKQLRKLQHRFEEERDRRYMEVAAEREKALQIKEEADKEALRLAREIQYYKDEKANGLQEQMMSERNLYATKADLYNGVEKVESQIDPLAVFISREQGRQNGTSISVGMVFAIIAAVGTISAVVALILNIGA
jgi:hypothetical protein